MSSEENAPNVRQEPDSVPAKGFVIVLAIGALVMGGACAVVWVLTPPRSMDLALEAPTGPYHGVDRDPIEHGERGMVWHAEARAALTTYEWIDRDAGLARIPIDRAMQMIAAGARPLDAPPLGDPDAEALDGGAPRAREDR